MTKIAGSVSISLGMDSRNRIRICTKMSWIRNTASKVSEVKGPDNPIVEAFLDDYRQIT